MRLVIARALWIAWAVIVWNVVLDHVIVVAGREYIVAARAAAQTAHVSHRYENMDAWMRPAVRRGVWTATAGAGAILAAGLALVRAAASRDSHR